MWACSLTEQAILDSAVSWSPIQVKCVVHIDAGRSSRRRQLFGERDWDHVASWRAKLKAMARKTSACESQPKPRIDRAVDSADQLSDPLGRPAGGHVCSPRRSLSPALSSTKESECTVARIRELHGRGRATGHYVCSTHTIRNHNVHIFKYNFYGATQCNVLQKGHIGVVQALRATKPRLTAARESLVAGPSGTLSCVL